MSAPRERLILGLLLLACFGLALALRLPLAPYAAVGSDSLGSFLAAWSASPGHLPKPPNPEGGYSLWLSVWPLVHLAGSLEQLFVMRFAQAALIAPLAAGAAWLLARPWGLREAVVAGLLAGGLVAVDPGLLDTLQSAFRGYGGPEWVALATLGLALGLRGWGWGLSLGLAALVGAAGQHPLAFGVVLGAVAALPLAWRGSGTRAVVVAVGVGLLCSLPRLSWLSWLADCDGGGVVSCLGQVALGSSEPEETALALLRRAAWDRGAVELGWLGVALGTGLLLATLPGRRRAPAGLVLFAVVGTLGVVALGLSISSLRPYHLRHLAAPLAVAAGLGLSRLGWPGLLGLLPVVLLTHRGVDPQGLQRVAALHDRAAAALPPGTLRLDALSAGRPPPVETAGIALSAVLGGRDPGELTVAGETQLVLVVAGPEALSLAARLEAPRLLAEPDLELLVFPDLVTAEATVCAALPAGARVGGAYDWMVALHPLEATLEGARWSCDGP